MKASDGVVANKQFHCPFCVCFFLSESDLALYLLAFPDVGDVHRDFFKHFHEFIEEVGTEFLSEDFCRVECVSAEQEISELESTLKVFFKMPFSERSNFRSARYAKSK